VYGVAAIDPFHVMESSPLALAVVTCRPKVQVATSVTLAPAVGVAVIADAAVQPAGRPARSAADARPLWAVVNASPPDSLAPEPLKRPVTEAMVYVVPSCVTAPDAEAGVNDQPAALDTA
jgi:hypothetical protein